MKRIALMVLSRHISSLGGIGFYVDSFLATHKDEFIIDILVDRPIKKTDIPFSHVKNANIICSPDSKSYSFSSNFLMFYENKSFFEMHINTLQTLIEAHKTKIYDCVFVNSFEMGVALKHANIEALLPTVVYTHYSFFYQNYPESLDTIGHGNMGLIDMDHCSMIPDKKFPFLSKPLHQLNLVTSEYDIFVDTQPKPENNTVLFNGTFRDSKRPKDFVKFCQVHKKKALIITNTKGETFFKEEFDKSGIEYEIRTHIFGKDKVDFISRAAMMFHPSEFEMMSYAVLEALFFMPVVVYNELWVDMCPLGMLTVINSIEEFSFDKIQMTQTERRDWVTDYFNPSTSSTQMNSMIDSLASHASCSSPSLKIVKDKINQLGGISIEDYWTQIKKRESVSYFDMVTLYKISKNVPVTQTTDQSFFGDRVVSGLESLF